MVFSVKPNTGAETVVHSFCIQQNCTDGTNPVAGLINVKGTLILSPQKFAHLTAFAGSREPGRGFPFANSP